MKSENKLTWYRLLRALLAAYTLVVGALLALAAIRIYMEGVAPENMLGAGVYVHPVYSPEIIAAHFRPIAGVVYGYLAFAAAMCIVKLALPKEKDGMAIEAASTVRFLERRINAAKLNTSEGRAVQREMRYRKLLLWMQWAVYAVCIVLSAEWMFSPSSFASLELEHEMAQFALHVFPRIIIALGAACMFAQLNHASAAREIPALQKILSRELPEKSGGASEKTRLVLRIAIYALAVLFIALGMKNGGMRDVLVKAANICTECIGLG